jgi:hypothetical protein
MTSEKYQMEFNRLAQQGYRLIDVSGYGIANNDRYAAIWSKQIGDAWVARHGLTSTQYQKEFNHWTKEGYRLKHVSGYCIGGKRRFAAIWEHSTGPAWVARHNMTSDQYQAEFDKYATQGYRLACVSGY